MAFVPLGYSGTIHPIKASYVTDHVEVTLTLTVPTAGPSAYPTWGVPDRVFVYVYWDHNFSDALTAYTYNGLRFDGNTAVSGTTYTIPANLGDPGYNATLNRDGRPIPVSNAIRVVAVWIWNANDPNTGYEEDLGIIGITPGIGGGDTPFDGGPFIPTDDPEIPPVYIADCSTQFARLCRKCGRRLKESENGVCFRATCFDVPPPPVPVSPTVVFGGEGSTSGGNSYMP